ncbi:MAG: TIM barrel protein [Clostridiales bacterium]|nr:TIM barrel protein [Clostridiales bacterium]
MADFLSERTAVMSYTYHRFSMDYFLRSMEALGIRNIDLWTGTPQFCSLYNTTDEAEALGREFSRRGFRIVSTTPEIVGYPFNLASADAALRAFSLNYAKKAIRDAAAMGSPLMLISSGYGLFDEPAEEAFQRSAQSLREAAEAAAREGVALVLEHLTRLTANLINSLDALDRMLRLVGHPALKAVIDVGQMSVFGETIPAYFERLGAGAIRHMHVMDGRPGAHLAFGDGILPVGQYIRQALEAGYGGYFAMELNDRCNMEDPHAAHERSVNLLKTWLADGTIEY